jgi:hypothetical protein
LRGDLIQQFKLFKGYDSVNLSNAKEMNSQSIEGPASGIRGHKHRLLVETISNCLVRENFFSNRVAFAWNYLPDTVIYSKSINSFKSNLDKVDLCKILKDKKKIKTLH